MRAVYSLTLLIKIDLKGDEKLLRQILENNLFCEFGFDDEDVVVDMYYDDLKIDSIDQKKNPTEVKASYLLELSPKKRDLKEAELKTKIEAVNKFFQKNRKIGMYNYDGGADLEFEFKITGYEIKENMEFDPKLPVESGTFIEAESVLLIPMAESGELEQIEYKKEEMNPELSILKGKEPIKKIEVSEDEQQVKIQTDNQEKLISLNQKVDLFKLDKDQYKKLNISSIFALYPNQEPQKKEPLLDFLGVNSILESCGDIEVDYKKVNDAYNKMVRERKTIDRNIKTKGNSHKVKLKKLEGFFSNGIYKQDQWLTLANELDKLDEEIGKLKNQSNSLKTDESKLAGNLKELKKRLKACKSYAKEKVKAKKKLGTKSNWLVDPETIKDGVDVQFISTKSLKKKDIYSIAIEDYVNESWSAEDKDEFKNLIKQTLEWNEESWDDFSPEEREMYLRNWDIEIDGKYLDKKWNSLPEDIKDQIESKIAENLKIDIEAKLSWNLISTKRLMINALFSKKGNEWEALNKGVDKKELDKHFTEIDKETAKELWETEPVYAIGYEGSDRLIESKDDLDKFEMFAVEKIPHRNFMRIRILEPDYEDWYSLKKKGRYYYIASDSDKETSKFITLDIGDLKEKGIQGIAFIRGVPKSIELKAGSKINTKDWRSQAIRIEYSKIKSSGQDHPLDQIDKALKHYEKDIIEFLNNEYPELTEIKIVPKGLDFQIELLGNKGESEKLIRLNSITFEEGSSVDITKGNVYLGRDVEDIGETGFSEVSEIEKTLEQIKIDYNQGIITKRSLNSRLMRLSFITVKSNKGELAKEEKKKEALKLINDYREEVGFNPLDIEDYLQSVKH